MHNPRHKSFYNWHAIQSHKEQNLFAVPRTERGI